VVLSQTASGNLKEQIRDTKHFLLGEVTMRKLYGLIAVLMVITMIMTACGQQAETDSRVTETGEVEEVVINPYLGSNKLDGNGVPKTFFDDVHVRRGFAYAFDWDAVVDQLFNGEALQSKVLPLPGMPGFDPTAAYYYYDLEKSAEEFKLADVDKDGIPAGEDPDDIWEMGFRLQMLYNAGNTTRQTYGEILQESLSQVNEKFSIEILGLPWPSYLAAQRSHKIPIMTAGWQEDIHDPHNWYQPYTVGSIGSRQGFPEDVTAQFRELLNEGISIVDPAARHEVYKRFNQIYYDLVVGFPVVYATSHNYEQKWIEGRLMNPIFAGDYYRTISKTAEANDPTTLVQATTGDSDTFDPALLYDTASGEIVQNIYETLVFYDGEATDKFVPQLAESWKVSDDGIVWTFTIRQGVKFHDGGDLTPTDVAYSFQRGLLQGGYISPQALLAEPFLGVGNDDITMIVDDGASADDREALLANDPAVLKAACDKVQAAIVPDDAAGTVTMTLAQSWGPFLATIANTWGSILDKEWVMENGGWDGTCDTWQNFYAMTSAEDPFTTIANGTGAFKLDHWTQGQEIVLNKFDGYWGEPAKLDRVMIQIITEFGTRFTMLQAGDADWIDVPAEFRAQIDPYVGESRLYDPETNGYKDPQPVCSVDTEKLGLERFEICATPSDKPLTLYYGRPGISQDVVLFNLSIQ
jgi:ABC-type transport system substrate-binding protein